ncbi:MAG: hypothetical protein ACI96M_003181, partial [Candidatus Azotimanducaceae bacterium]
EVVTRMLKEVALHKANLSVQKPAMDVRLGG